MEDETGRVCNMYEGQKECIQGVGGKFRRMETTIILCPYFVRRISSLEPLLLPLNS